MADVQERWVIVWFPPDAEQRERPFQSEAAARKFARTDGVAGWCPSMVYRKTTTVIEERIVVPLFTPEPHDSEDA